MKNHPEARAQDLKDAFYDTSIKGIICAIGGDDTYRTLPYLLDDKDFINAVQNNPKLFTGFSDTTINHLMFYKLGIGTFYGPNFVCDLAELDKQMLPYTKRAFLKYFEYHNEDCIESSNIWYEERTDFSIDAVGTSRVEHLEEKGYEVLQGKEKFSGRLLGGCLESFYDILTNTRYDNEKAICEKYGIFPTLNEWKNKILFLETCEEKPKPEKFEKELLTLKNAGIFDVISGIIVGKPQDEQYYEQYKEIYCKTIENKDLPIIYNVNFGHAQPKCIIPYGIETEVDLDKKVITLKESIFA
ncbi:Muramoyltetrapeptide carboxypeptidase LdcA (peptidoglycan recycling) [Clostridium uliginosum]|uniref:Muramoyltetrapeptide carboxypeptidase LdcA (Peptidoglycan recycling) n=1 Tax=Clostridium uliginosum TaxID=119641 RepID=A0A1I1J4X9_9CLOT|nr:Muramoyltetrapeptide carboxypeptidase LdcA (peptidoglycan recycling) [Clostridium uliginosum]